MRGGDEASQAAARLRILGPLGSGGFGAVYEAVDERTGQHVAVKELDNLSADSIARFKHEFRILTDHHHTNLVGLKELIEHNGRWLIVMELVPGTDLLRHVRPENDNAGHAGYDEQRLRQALGGMVEGLRALHSFGVVHRDLKPSNVRVRPDGRAVLLDFGLATSVDPKQQSTHAMAIGTVPYMAPEQANGQAIGPATDLYALGVCLFEALTGRTPFEGDSAVQILLDKQRLVAPRVTSLEPTVPADLDELCSALLAIEPAARPSAEQVLAVLTSAPVSPRPPGPAQGPPEDLFAGRDAELAHLEHALAKNHEGELRVVLIEGESGVGKSELVAEFLRRARTRDPELIALRGRCYENEQVSYKAFDGCIDELARVLRRLDERACAALLPVRAALLAQLFPVLRNIKAVAQAPREDSSADPTARRLEAFGALANLLGKLAEERPIVLVIDDLQWADAESFRLLTALSEHTPRPAVLLLATVRPRDELEPEVRAQLEEVRKREHVDVVQLLGLPRAHAKELARKLLGPSIEERWLDMIADESQGHPLFLSELLQYTQSHDFAARGSLSLEAALRARIERLERHARELFELVALAGRPHPAAVFAAALGVNVDETARGLLATKLLRQRKGHELGCYHDRVRHAAVGLIAKSRLPGLHHQLAAALEQFPAVDPSEQARHWDLAGDAERASAAYERAATRARETLAFKRAAQFCERAIELAASPLDARSQQLTVQRAHALACAGDNHRASLLYQQAADVARGIERVRLRGQAAKHMMLSARIGPGFAAARALLLELKFSVPLGTAAALLRIAWDVLRLRFQQVFGGKLARGEVAHEQAVLDAVHDNLYTIATVHPLAYSVLAMQLARRALRLGLPSERANALATLAWFRSVRGAREPAVAMLTEGLKLLEGVEQQPHQRATFVFTAGSAYMAAMDWTLAEKHLRSAQQLVQEQCPDQPWLLTSIRYHLGGTWYHLGEQARLARELERWLAEARERNDPLAVALLMGMGYGFVRHLLRDDPDGALREMEETIAAIPQSPYSFAHFGEMLAATFSLLYRGGADALRFFDEYQRKHGREYLLRTHTGTVARALLHGLALFAAVASAPPDERGALLKRAKRAFDGLRRDPSPFTQACIALSDAQLDFLDGKPERALAHAREARAQFRGLHHQNERAALYVEGLLEADEHGREKCEDALEALRAQGFVNPLRAIGIHAPLHALLGTFARSDKPAGKPLLLDRYEIVGPLGRGGFGTVVSARDVRTGRMLALKELVQSGGVSLERFKKEFRALANLHHENIVQLDALFEHERRWYIAMELVDGTDLVSYVRPFGECDEERLRGVFLGLANGLSTLHGKGFVHRDVKPENVLVTREGRPVLLDFGLIARAGDPEERAPVGSAEYAAPEQLAGAMPHTSADVYALGACLYATLTGERPFAALSQTALVQAKQTSPAPLPRPLGSGDIASLCTRMLATAPGARPSLSEVVELLARQSANPSERPSTRSDAADASRELSLIGRERELLLLRTAFEETCDAGLTLALVEGESGLGKSALTSHFARQLRRDTPNLHVLESRCYENELVAFKAFDGAVDTLAQLLRSLPNPRCEALLPRRAALLAQLFPVLSSVPAIAQASKKGLPADPAARKQAGGDCFLELLEKLSAQCELLLVIDDLQWADSESFDMLRALARRAAALPFLVVCTMRPLAELDAPVRDELQKLAALPNTVKLVLGPLDARATTELAGQLLDLPDDAPRLAELARESKGHPLFLRELVEHEKGGTGGRARTLTLDAALAARIDALPPAARALLGLVALADKPYGTHVYARALGLAELPRDALLALLSQGLARRGGDKLACSHDHIRRIALAALTPSERSEVAGKLAAALARDSRTDPADRARFWDEAGDVAQASEAYELAGDAALQGLAFARAEQHYARALVLLGEQPSDPRWQRLLVAQGHALVRAGRSAEAAGVFQRAAEHAQGETKVRLRIGVAQHLIQSAQVEQGMRAATALLGELGLSLPASERAAKTRIAWDRARVKLRGVGLRARSASPQERLVLEALHGLASPVRAVSFLSGSALVVQYLRRALDAGDPVHTARALAYEALWRSINRVEGNQDSLFAESLALAETTDEPVLLAEVELTQGLACIAQNQLKLAPTHLTRAHELLTSHCPGQPWLLTATRMYLGSAWFHAGNFQELRRHAGAWVEEARARDDSYAVAALTGFGAASLRHLLDDDPESALAELEDAMRPWPNEPFTTNHLGAVFTTSAVLASYGDGSRLIDHLDALAPVLERAYLMRTPNARLWLLTSRVHGLCQAYESREHPSTAGLIARIQVQRRTLARMPGVLSRAAALVAEGAICSMRGERSAAAARLRQACELSSVGDHYHRLGRAYTLGALEGGVTGRERCALVRAQVRAEGFRDERRGLALRVGNLRLLEQLENS